MEHESVPTPDALLAALKEQVVCYQRLAKLADQQHDHVQRGQVEALLDVLSSRQRVLDDIARLERIIAPVKRQWSEYAGAFLDQPRRAAAELALSDTRRLLEQITIADRNDAMVLQQRKLNLGKQITQATAAKQINRNYAASAYGKGRGPTVDFTR